MWQEVSLLGKDLLPIFRLFATDALCGYGPGLKPFKGDGLPADFTFIVGTGFNTLQGQTHFLDKTALPGAESKLHGLMGLGRCPVRIFKKTTGPIIRILYSVLLKMRLLNSFYLYSG